MNVINKMNNFNNVGEFIDCIEKLLPNGLWKEFQLEVAPNIIWSPAPIIIKEFSPTYPWYAPPSYPIVQYSATMPINSDNTRALCNGTYDVELSVGQN